MTLASSLDLRLYLITDPDLTGERSLLDVVDKASTSGVGLVQLRDKGAEARDLLALAEALKALLAPKNVPLVVNDRVDVAAAAVSAAILASPICRRPQREKSWARMRSLACRSTGSNRRRPRHPLPSTMLPTARLRLPARNQCRKAGRN